jgi:hypothetical protein
LQFTEMSGCPNNRETNLQIFCSWYQVALRVNNVPLFLALMHFYRDSIAVTPIFCMSILSVKKWICASI